jgi:glycosyltransferase involved in cell wall biosynthesis
MTLVSVIVPNYNHARYLTQRLESIFNQTYENFEVILLDDGSTDESVSILTSYQSHPKVSHLILNNENSGSPFNQWKKGLELSRGDFVWIAESDDWAETQFLQEMMHMKDMNPDSVILYCQSAVVNEDGHFLSDNSFWTQDLDEKRWRGYFTNDGIYECRDYLSIKSSIPNASAVVFKKSAADQSDGYWLNFKKSGDSVFWAGLLTKGKISYSPMVLNNFRKSDQSTRNVTTRDKRMYKSLEKLMYLHYLKANNLIPVRRYVMRRFKESARSLYLLLRIRLFISQTTTRLFLRALFNMPFQ